MQSLLKSTLLLLTFTFSYIVYGQENIDTLLDLSPAKGEKVFATFKSGHLINAQTTETIHKGELEFKVDHRFGDIAGDAGGARNFFGLDESTDIRIGFDYGLSDRITLGIARAKGATAVRQIYDFNAKYRFIDQTTDNSIPVTVAFFGSANISGIAKSSDPASVTNYRNFSDRWSYVSQLIIARKFNPYFSVEIIPSYVHRNFTAFGDQNNMFALGAGGRLKVTKRMALVADYFIPFRQKSKKEYIEAVNNQRFYNALGVGLEIETGGHVFHLNFTNATAIQESQFIAETTSTWSKGQYRWGFSIARRFGLMTKKNKE